MLRTAKANSKKLKCPSQNLKLSFVKDVHKPTQTPSLRNWPKLKDGLRETAGQTCGVRSQGAEARRHPVARAGAGLRWPQVRRVQQAPDSGAGPGDGTHTLDSSLCAGHRSTSRERPARRSRVPPGCRRPLLHSLSCAQRRATVAARAVSRARQAPAPAGGASGPGVSHCCVCCLGRSARTPRNALRGPHPLRPPGPRCQCLRQSWRRLSWGRAEPPSRLRAAGCAPALFVPRAHPHFVPPRPCPPSGWSAE